MSDETKNELTQEPAREPGDDPTTVDSFLQRLVDVVNTSPIVFSVTLVVGGSLVAGDLIGYKAYFREFADAFTSALSEAGFRQENTEKIHRAISGVGTDDEDALSAENTSGRPPLYIHLRNATIFHGDTRVPTTGGALWRGKLSAVSGFWLGRAEITPR